MRSYGEILISGGATALALSTTAGIVTQFSATGGANGTAYGPDIIPDKANSRLKVLPGYYLLDAWLELVGDAEADITLRVRKNAVAYSGLQGTDVLRQNIKTFSPTLSPALIAQGTAAESAALTVTGLLTTDKLLSVVKPTNQAGLAMGFARISAADTLRINFINVPGAGGNLTPTPAEIYTVVVGRFGKQTIRIFGVLPVFATDAPGTLSSFADPSGVGGAGGAPKNMVPVDLSLESSTGTPNVTISNGRLSLTGLAA